MRTHFFLPMMSPNRPAIRDPIAADAWRQATVMPVMDGSTSPCLPYIPPCSEKKRFTKTGFTRRPAMIPNHGVNGHGSLGCQGCHTLIVTEKRISQAAKGARHPQKRLPDEWIARLVGLGLESALQPAHPIVGRGDLAWSRTLHRGLADFLRGRHDGLQEKRLGQSRERILWAGDSKRQRMRGICSNICSDRWTLLVEPKQPLAGSPRGF